jgi:hypothetical protein
MFAVELCNLLSPLSKRSSNNRRLLFAILFVITYLLHDNIVEHDLSPVNQNISSSNNTTTTTHASNNHKYIHLTTNSNAYTEQHTPYNTQNHTIRISFRLHNQLNEGLPTKFLSVKPYMCGSNKAPLPTSLSQSTVLNFTTTISTNLKIVHVGDSLSQQFVQGFDATLLGSSYEYNRHVLAEYFYEGKIYSHNCLSVAAPIRGGGVSSYWRITDLLSNTNRRKEARCAKEELQLKQRIGWSNTQSIQLVEHRYTVDLDESVVKQILDTRVPQPMPRPIEISVGSYDVAVLRIPHGWMDIVDITRDRIIEAINLSHDNLGVDTVLITTLPLNNNVLTSDDWEGIYKINVIIRDVAMNWESIRQNKRGVKYILVQEFGQFTNEILWKSAQHLGIYKNIANYSDTKNQYNNGWELSGTSFLLDRLPLAKRKWPPSIPMVCAQPPGVNEKSNACIRNRISSDGIHWCIETLGTRYSASIACLLGCVYNGDEKEKMEMKNDDTGLRQCERGCNEQFMSIKPVEESWIGNEMTLFSQS